MCRNLQLDGTAAEVYLILLRYLGELAPRHTDRPRQNDDRPNKWKRDLASTNAQYCSLGDSPDRQVEPRRSWSSAIIVMLLCAPDVSGIS